MAMERVKDTIRLATPRSQYYIEQGTGHGKPTMDCQLYVSQSAEHMGGPTGWLRVTHGDG